ncbi:hypothetical protein TNIN_254991 [Trichonephila inaurata madagascariensis]|uniref:Uncharacterized protein n=1 Tax=Trichonephila inaurata madagascariensis TaxID=2747483 RepID=A0A8X6WNG2_9ARAC|nr:hypothetical protein TNIN_254991 [Trichonephila inaurata madagascariensis]
MINSRRFYPGAVVQRERYSTCVGGKRGPRRCNGAWCAKLREVRFRGAELIAPRNHPSRASVNGSQPFGGMPDTTVPAPVSVSCAILCINRLCLSISSMLNWER